MSLDSYLIHKCVIENPAAGELNAYNNKVRAYATPITDVRCRLVEDRERIWNDERRESMVQTTYKLLLPANVELNERARISQVTLEDGSTMLDTFTVTEVLVRRGRNAHHQTAMVERIS